MSRLIVKNLPSSFNAEKLCNKFKEFGVITDCKLIHNENGKSRRFAFVGFQNEDSCAKAKEHFDQSLILNQKIIVEYCKSFNEEKNTTVTRTSTEKKTVSKKEGRHHLTENGYWIRMGNCPYKIKKHQVADFFHPLVPKTVDFQKHESGNRTGNIYVEFSNDSECQTAMKNNGDYLKNRCIDIKVCVNKNSSKVVPNSQHKKKIYEVKQDSTEVEDISESGRLFVRNLPYSCSDDDFENLFKTFGTLSEVTLPIDSETKKNKGIGFVTYMFPEHAIQAFNKLDGSIFHGRMLHLLPAKTKVEKNPTEQNFSSGSSYKTEKSLKTAKNSQSSHNWNSLFIGTNAVVDAVADKYGADKRDVLESTKSHSTAVKVALGETSIVKETRDFLLANNVSLDAFSQPNAKRSKTVLIAKNLPAGATSSELRQLFEKHTKLNKVLLTPAGVTAIIECENAISAKAAFTKLAYRSFHHKPLYLEWAPMDTFVKNNPANETASTGTIDQASSSNDQDGKPTSTLQNDTIINDSSNTNSLTLFVKNLNFDTDEDEMRKHFSKCGPLVSCVISKKKLPRENKFLSMGYGFVEYAVKSNGLDALKTLQHSELDGHKLELKMSEKSTIPSSQNQRKNQVDKKPGSSKILVRNIPFQATKSEISALFKSFGELRTVRLPLKLNVGNTHNNNSHRGFAFIDYVTMDNAKSAFDALCHSTHLYGRRLVLEWADKDDSNVETLRRKTTEHFHGVAKRRKGLEEFETALLNTQLLEENDD